MRIFSPVLAGLVVLASSGAARADDATMPRPPERSTAARQPSLATAGLLVFAGAYAYSATLAALYRNDDGRVATTMFLPVAGPWLTLKNDRFDGRSTITGRLIDATRANQCSGDAVICPGVLPFIPLALIEYGLLVVDGVGQATGLVLAMVGAAADDPTDRSGSAPLRPKLSISPTLAGGPGLALSITRW